jgi:hypothetical protein
MWVIPSVPPFAGIFEDGQYFTYPVLAVRRQQGVEGHHYSSGPIACYRPNKEWFFPAQAYISVPENTFELFKRRAIFLTGGHNWRAPAKSKTPFAI